MGRYEIERIDTIVVGGGQAGLAVGYHLARRGLPFLILDAHDRIGDAWRTRWDSLRLFTPAGYDGLPGMRFPAPRTAYPTKDEMADFLEAYAHRFELPVRTGVRVDALAKNGAGFALAAGDLRFEADNVVVAMSSDLRPWTAGLRVGARPASRPDPLPQLPQSFAAAGRRRAHRRSGQLGGRHRHGSGEAAHHPAVGTRRRAHPVPDQPVHRRNRIPRRPLRISPCAQGETRGSGASSRASWPSTTAYRSYGSSRNTSSRPASSGFRGPSAFRKGCRCSRMAGCLTSPT